MSFRARAFTIEGYLDVETNIPLEQLAVGDVVLGLADADAPDEPRTVHAVTAALGRHHVPTEDPTRMESFLISIGLERLVAAGPVEGILVDSGVGDPGLFALEITSVLDRVIF